MEPVSNPSYESDQWQAIGVAISGLITLIGTALTIWSGIITKRHESKIKSAEIKASKFEAERKAREVYEDALIAAAGNLSAMSFLGRGEPKELELLSRTESEINKALERGERILIDRFSA